MGEDEKLSEKQILEEILGKMKPIETVTKALQRLGSNTNSVIPAWKQKRMEKLARRKMKAAGKNDTSKYEVNENEGNTEDLKKMTNFVDNLSRRGYYDVYTDTYEKIKYKISNMDKPKVQEEELDMFGDSDPVKSSENAAELEDQETKWEYKIGDDGKVTGPLTTSAMIKLKETNKSGECFCRRLNTNSSFYNINRVDFD